jgi:hypothetical protein
MKSFAEAFAKVRPIVVVVNAAVGATPVVTTASASVLDSIILDPKQRGSINYAKARIAIEESIPNRRDKRLAKLAVVEHLGGVLMHPKAVFPMKTPPPNFVQFGDSSKARF